MTIIEQTEDFVSRLFKDKLSAIYTYHNFNHTIDVVFAAKKLAESENLTPSDKEILLIAAWFHDAGYINGSINHEEASIILASTFLKEQSADFIAKVSNLIRATKYDYEPQTILEKIIKDADFFHLTSINYISSLDDLRMEWQNADHKFCTNEQWIKENKNFLANRHRFYTDFALENWQPLKEKNIKIIQKEVDRIELKNKKKKKKTNKAEKPDRGIDTLFKITLVNHTRLSGIADNKANILLSVNAIIISIALSSLIPKLISPKNANLIIPTFILIMFSVITIIFAILSTRPKVTKSFFTKQDIADRKVNLLFFGNFYKMPLEEYQEAVNKMFKDRDYLYNSMIKDLYFLGLVLEKKYRLLRIAYNFFMLGIIMSVISFVIAFKIIGV